MPFNFMLGLGVAVLVTGCTAGWIHHPSPQTKALVDDLKLEGFTCNANHTSVVCVQTEPLRNKRPSKCDSQRGCVRQPDQLIYNRYIIKQDASGVPGIQHDLLRETAVIGS